MFFLYILNGCAEWLFKKQKRPRSVQFAKVLEPFFFVFEFFFVKSIFHGKQKLKKEEDNEERRILTPWLKWKCTKCNFLCLFSFDFPKWSTNLCFPDVVLVYHRWEYWPFCVNQFWPYLFNFFVCEEKKHEIRKSYAI